MQNKNLAESNRFRLMFSVLPDVEFFCQSVTLPSVNLDQTEASSPTFNVPLPGNRISYDPISIVYYLDEKWETWGSLFQWVNGFSRDDGFVPPDQAADVSLATVEVLHNSNFPYRSFQFEGIFPTTVESPTLAYTDSADILLSATFSFQGMKFQ